MADAGGRLGRKARTKDAVVEMGGTHSLISYDMWIVGTGSIRYVLPPVGSAYIPWARRGTSKVASRRAPGYVSPKH